MKQMSRDPLASSKARKAERKADANAGLITIKPLGSTASASTSAVGVGGANGSSFVCFLLLLFISFFNYDQ